MPDKNKDEIPNIPDTFDNVVGSLIGDGHGDQEVLDAVYSGQLPIGDIELDCAVLDGGVRVLSERAVHRAFGSKRGGSHWKRMRENEGGANLPVFSVREELFSLYFQQLGLGAETAHFVQNKFWRNARARHFGRTTPRDLRCFPIGPEGWRPSQVSGTFGHAG